MNYSENTRLLALQTAIQHARDTYEFAGLAVTVAYGKGPGHTIVVGTDEKGYPLTDDSLFPIASVTKLSVALAILRLSDRGLLSINDPLGNFVSNAASARSGITLSQLLTHSAGLPDFPEDAWTYSASLDWQIHVQACLRIATIAPPGSRVAYSNVDYGLLALVIERLTGLPLRDAITELVIQPLSIEAYLGIDAQPVGQGE